uniref:Uncharacterized protein n=1 Tax=Anguilla anguilla TaxID=7936 RepID=A0A0E9RJL4_ANGAN
MSHTLAIIFAYIIFSMHLRQIKYGIFRLRSNSM